MVGAEERGPVPREAASKLRCGRRHGTLGPYAGRPRLASEGQRPYEENGRVWVANSGRCVW